MVCPKCGGKVHVVDNVNTNENETYRQKECLKCRHVFYTVEFEVDNDKSLKDTWKNNHRRNYNQEVIFMGDEELEAFLVALAPLSEIWMFTYNNFKKQGLNDNEAFKHTKAFMEVFASGMLGAIPDDEESDS